MLAAAFRSELLGDLDHVSWVPTIGQDSARPSLAAPADLLVEREDALSADLPLAQPVAVDPSAQPPRESKSPSGSPKLIRGVKHVNVNTAHIGRVGEAWARAAVLDAILGLDPPKRAQAVKAMAAVLSARFRGDPVNQVLAYAEAFTDAVEEDEAIEALVRFVHLSAVSDAFVFDLLGFLGGAADDGNPESHVQFLEVKSASGRSFEVSKNEWETAMLPEVSDRYAFLVVLRDDKGQPIALELLSNPPSLLAEKKLAKEPNGWTVVYRNAPSSAVPNRAAVSIAFCSAWTHRQMS